MYRLMHITLLTAYLLVSSNAFGQAHIQSNDIIVIEAEHFATQHLDTTRRWLVFDGTNDEHNYADADLPHYNNASNGAYIEILPDTRSNHYEKLIRGENFSNIPGKIGVLSYPIFFEKPGKYYVWARAYSTGSEDNGIHIGLNGQWPETGQRLQLCKGKHQWTWSSAQRIKTNHCGVPNTIFVDVPSEGVHNLMISMREDGFELDKLLLTQDSTYLPKGKEKPETLSIQPRLKEKTHLFGINEYRRIVRAIDDFIITDAKSIAYYADNEQYALAINTSNHPKDTFAYAQYVVQAKEKGTHLLTLVTLAEMAGESTYRMYLNNQLIGEFTNPVTDTNYQEVHFKMDNITLKKGDLLKVASNSATNNSISKNNKTAYSSGIWRALVMSKE